MTDLISREAAIKASVMAADEWGEQVREALEALPSVEPEITLKDVEAYCKPRCLSIVADEFLYLISKGTR